jgi:Ca2+-transporting ATPase
VLLDDSFTSMVAAIRLGRRIYDNLQKAILFILAIHVPIAGLTILPVVLKLPLLLLPVHIVFLELLIDPACSLVYEAEAEEADIMTRKPRSSGARLLPLGNLLSTLVQGAAILALVLGMYVGLLRQGHPVEQARSGAFLTLILSNLSLILVNRARNAGILNTLKSPNRAFVVIALGAIALLLVIFSIAPLRSLFGFSTLHLPDLGLSIIVGVSSLFVTAMIRALFKRSALQS